MEANLAVLIDFENIAAGTEKEGLGRFDVDALLKRVKDKGRVLVARSYADWGRFARFKQSLLMANVTMIELTSHGMQDKNRADIAMVVDALELAFTKPYVDTFVVVSGDSDFTPMVLKMRELDKRVIGCGTRSSTSRLLIEACDEFFFYDSIVQTKKRRSRPANQKKGYDLEEAFELLVDAIEGLQRENPDPPLASVVKSAMQRKSPDFTEADFKFSSFGRFLEAAQKQGKVRVSRDQKSGGYRVDTPEPGGLSSAVERRSAPAVSASDDGAWFDPYAPESAHDLISALSTDGYNPLAAPTRMAILDLVEQNVKDREKKKRRINAQFIHDDVRKRMKKTHPDVPARAIRNVFNALMRGGVFIHRDGSAVRTGLASFHLEKDAQEINQRLTNVYLDLLHEEGADLADAATLAELFLGSADRNREIEEIVAWLHASEVDEGDESEDIDDGDDLDLDSILEVDPDTVEVDKVLEASDDSDEDDALEVAPDEEPDAKPKKRRRSRKKKPEAEAADGGDKADNADDGADAEPEVVEAAKAAEPANGETELEPKAKPKTKRRPRKKKAEAAPAE